MQRRRPSQPQPPKNQEEKTKTKQNSYVHVRLTAHWKTMNQTSSVKNSYAQLRQWISDLWKLWSYHMNLIIQCMFHSLMTHNIQNPISAHYVAPTSLTSQQCCQVFHQKWQQSQRTSFRYHHYRTKATLSLSTCKTKSDICSICILSTWTNRPNFQPCKYFMILVTAPTGEQPFPFKCHWTTNRWK